MKYSDWKKTFVDGGSKKAYNKNIGSRISMNKTANDFEIKRPDYKFVEYNANADYSVNVPGLPDVVNRGLSDACRNTAEMGSARQCEVLNLVDLTEGKLVYHEIGEFDEIGGKGFWKFIGKNPEGKYAFVHNHLTDGFLSSTDMQTFVGNSQIRVMISTSNNGLKRIAYGDNKRPGIYFDLYYQEDIEKLRNKLKNGIINPADYSFELEKMIVENAIRDYSNLGFWGVDGPCITELRKLQQRTSGLWKRPLLKHLFIMTE